MGGSSSIPARGRVGTSNDATRRASPNQSASSFTPSGSPRSTDGGITTGTADPEPASAPRGETGPPPSDGRKLVLIVWDIENVRLPRRTAPGMTPTNVVGYIKKEFITDQQRVEYRTVVAVTEDMLTYIRSNHTDFVKEMVPYCSLLVASNNGKRDADAVLKRELQHFMAEYAHLARARPRQLTIVLITGDECFLDTVRDAWQAGFNVELLHGDSASSALLAQTYSRPPCRWLDFLAKYSPARSLALM